MIAEVAESSDRASGPRKAQGRGPEEGLTIERRHHGSDIGGGNAPKPMSKKDNGRGKESNFKNDHLTNGQKRICVFVEPSRHYDGIDRKTVPCDYEEALQKLGAPNSCWRGINDSQGHVPIWHETEENATSEQVESTQGLGRGHAWPFKDASIAVLIAG